MCVCVCVFDLKCFLALEVDTEQESKQKIYQHSASTVLRMCLLRIVFVCGLSYTLVANIFSLAGTHKTHVPLVVRRFYSVPFSVACLLIILHSGMQARNKESA